MKLLLALAITLVACVSCSDLQSQSYELTGNRRSGPVDVEVPTSLGRPWFCHDLECPKFKVVNKTEVYETREYEAGDGPSSAGDSAALGLHPCSCVVQMRHILCMHVTIHPAHLSSYV